MYCTSAVENVLEVWSISSVISIDCGLNMRKPANCRPSLVPASG
jgi:hypothetical protein